jgi:hypothetical protein
MAHLRIEMICSGGPARTDQKGLHARIDHDPRFCVFVKMQTFQKLDHLGDAHLFMEMGREQCGVLADAIAVCGHGGHPGIDRSQGSGSRDSDPVNRGRWRAAENS